MFKFKKQNKPKIDLRKKEKTKIEKHFEIIKTIIKQPETLTIIIFGIIFICLVIFAMHEAICYFVYNLGGL